MHPEHASRVFGAATQESILAELKGLGVQILDEGRIGGLNGVLLAAAMENGLHGACLLGEMPHILVQLPFPKASLAILQRFAAWSETEIDLTQLAEQAQAVDEKLGELLAKVQTAMEEQETPAEDEGVIAEPSEAGGLGPQDAQRIERLFEQARQDRSKAYELKGELDRLDVFSAYEDRFLDLFKKTD
jgi:hypothetical protein